MQIKIVLGNLELVVNRLKAAEAFSRVGGIPLM